MRKICVCGAFMDGTQTSDGQTIKTRNLYDAYVAMYGSDLVSKIDTQGSKFTLPFNLVWKLVTAESFIMLPAMNGLKVISPFLYHCNKIFHRKLFYSVIGGWLPSFLENRSRLSRCLQGFDKIYVETKTMKSNLDSRGFDNVIVAPNFKNIKQIPISELKEWTEKPLRLVTFSRVMKQKGIEDVVRVIERINTEKKSTIYTLDIYGAIPSAEIQWFDTLSDRFPNYIRYKGVAKPEDSVNILKRYYALLFPTRFYTEGVPGTIIDAYAAGVPVISSKWQSFDDVIDNGVTGYGYEFGNVEELYHLLKKCENTNAINKLKSNCSSRFLDYSFEKVLNIMHQK